MVIVSEQFVTIPIFFGTFVYSCVCSYAFVLHEDLDLLFGFGLCLFGFVLLLFDWKVWRIENGVVLGCE